MERSYRNTQYFLLLLGVVNQLRRAAVNFPLPPMLDISTGMTVQQISVLAFLTFSDQENVYQKDLENYFHLRRSTVSSLLTTLEKKNMVRRESVSHDARLKKIVLTESGQLLGQEIRKPLDYVGNILMDGLTEEEAAVFAAVLQKMQANLQELDI